MSKINQKLIGLCGYAGAGKNVIADAMSLPQLAFATALKDDVRPLTVGLGLDISEREDKEKARELLVAYGKLARSQKPAFCIERLHGARNFYYEDATIVITDVRYLNEVLYILNHGGMVVYIERPGVLPANDEERESFEAIWAARYAGEIDLDVIINSGTIEDAAQRVLDLHTQHGFEKYCAEDSDRCGCGTALTPAEKAEAMVIEHKAWRKMQEYHEHDIPADQIEEGPHTVYAHQFKSVFDGEPYTVYGPKELGPIDLNAPVSWNNYADVSVPAASARHVKPYESSSPFDNAETVRGTIDFSGLEAEEFPFAPHEIVAPPGMYLEVVPFARKVVIAYRPLPIRRTWAEQIVRLVTWLLE